VAALRGLGYQGWIGLEYAPLDSTAAGLGRLGLGGGAVSWSAQQS
jgi:hydroxypyruvate isomerase